MKWLGHMRRAFLRLNHVEAELDGALEKCIDGKRAVKLARDHILYARALVKVELTQHQTDYPDDNDNGETPAEYLEDAIEALGRLIFVVGRVSPMLEVPAPPDIIPGLEACKAAFEVARDALKGPTP